MPRPKKDKMKKKEEALHDIQQDHEQFLLAFEKPTQIYRFLRARQTISPTFMHRNLLYMQDRCSRVNTRRELFLMKDLLPVALASGNLVEKGGVVGNDDLNISVIGITMDPSMQSEHSKNASKKLRRVDVEVLLSKAMLNKRKESDFPFQEFSQGIVEVPVNPRACNDVSSVPFEKKDALIIIPASDFERTSVDGTSVKLFSLRIRVREAATDSDSESESEDSEEEAASENDEENTQQRKKKKLNEEEEEDDPAGISLKNLTSGPRRRKGRAGVYRRGEEKKRVAKTNSKEEEEEEDTDKNDTKQRILYYGSNKPPILKKNANASKPIMYEAELLIFNSDHECQAADGDYELLLNKNDADKLDDYKRKAVWESFDGGREIKVYSSFSGPCVKLQLKWSASARPGPLAGVDQKKEVKENNLEVTGKRTRTAALSSRQGRHAKNIEESEEIPEMEVNKVEYRKSKLGHRSKYANGLSNGCEHGGSGKVYYQFMYNNNTQQQTESRDDFYCPWCQLNCMALYGLMKHLKLCHPRFLFRYSQQPRGTNIIVTVNECYDGSYAGNPQNIFGQPGLAFSRRGPVRRIPVTDVLVYRPRRARKMKENCSLSELLEKEDVEALEAAQFSTGHRRLYFHSGTVLPIRPQEFDVDSDGEAEEPDWLFGHTKRMIDEFTDVNEGEKALMKLWNLHIMRFSCISDSQIEDECKRFIEMNIAHLAHHGLRRNLLLHFLCLVDFGVFKTSSVMTLMDHYDEVVGKHKSNPAQTDEVVHDIMSANFPEPDLLPRMKELEKIVAKN